jgi:hypothetical protein
MNEQLKPYKTVEEIAKKHRLEVSFIQKQLDMGAPIEHEHTKNKKLATEIALQHLDEIPDYYTRLKKMEIDAKKHHKKFKDVKEDAVTELQRGITELPNTSYGSIDNLMRRIMKKRKISAKKLHNDFVDKHNQTPDTWAKRNMKEETKSGDQGLHDWFNKSKSSDGKEGWVQLGGKFAGKPCARQPGQTSTPKCGSSKMSADLSAKEEERARRRKNRLDPNQPEKTGASKPTNVRTEEMDLQEVKDKAGKGSGKKDACYNKVKSRYDVWPSAYASGALVKCRKVGAANWGTKSEDCWDGYKQEGMKKKGKKMVPNCVPVKEETGMVRYCPKCQKDETQSECKYGPKYWDMFSLPSKLSGVAMSNPHYHANSPHPANESKEYDHEHSMARSELSTIVSAAKRLRKKMKGEGNIEAWVQSKITKAADYLDSAADYVDSGEMQKEQISFEIGSGHRQAQKQAKIRNLATGTTNAGEKSAAKSKLTGPSLPLADSYEYSNWREDFGLSEDWQSVNRKDKTDGLSQKAVNAYRRENPGSKLKTAVTEKNPKGKRAKRRSNFCSRMSGMKDKLTSTKTARDPDSRINKALRRWRCN